MAMTTVSGRVSPSNSIAGALRASSKGTLVGQPNHTSTHVLEKDDYLHRIEGVEPRAGRHVQFRRRLSEGRCVRLATLSMEMSL